MRNMGRTDRGRQQSDKMRGFSIVAGQRIRIELCVCPLKHCVWHFLPKPVTMETDKVCMCACVIARLCACEPLKRVSLSPPLTPLSVN